VETAYNQHLGTGAERAHEYGDRVHIIGDTFSLSMLGRLCSAESTQPEFNRLVAELYRHLFVRVVNTLFPTRVAEIDTRMKEFDPAGTFRGAVIDRETPVVVVDVARAGILPAQTCYDLANTLLDPSLVRQDHLVMARTTDSLGQVTGASILAEKVGGSVDDAWMLFPDPMGATGGSLAAAIDHYLDAHGTPKRIILLCLMITPNFVRAFRTRHPEAEIFTLRLDRGRSPADVLAKPLGADIERENGLTEVDYIVPGGGGFGELMNNSWV
jgi:uracil phosphoribosyltransferase